MKTQTLHNNRILKHLSLKESRILSPYLQAVQLSKGLVLFEAGQRIKQIYFPDQAVISCLSGTAEGGSIEICMVGQEGIVGLAALFSDRTTFRAVVQIPGRAYSIGCDVLRKEFGRCDLVHHVLLRYTSVLLIQLAQTAVCNKFHSIDKRFSRWLLTAHDRTASNEIPMTQEGLARILGSRRASVSGVAAAFQRKGLLQYKRGVIKILDRRSLESNVCECYHTISAAYDFAPLDQ